MTNATATADPHVQRTVEAIWRMESGRIIGALARVLRDVGLAEELAQDALVAALEQWPRSGVPDNPAAWLTAAAKHRAIDAIRRRELHARKEDALTYEIENQLSDAAPNLDAAIESAFDEPIGDDLLRLIFIACHPVLSREARTALTLRLLGGLTTDEIARAFLTPEPTIAQRIVRAKRTLAEARAPFELPPPAELAARLDVPGDRIVVSDDGVGFDPETLGLRTGNGGGFGLFNIRERLKDFGAGLKIETVSGSGTRITISAAIT